MATPFPRSRRTLGFVLLCLFFLTLAAAGRALAAAEPNTVLTNTAANLERITGGQIEIRATAPLLEERALPLVCQTLTTAFQEAAADPETKERLDRIVHVIVIQAWFAGGEMHHVKLKDEVLTIQTLTDQAEIDALRPLIVEVLKKVAHLDAKRTR